MEKRWFKRFLQSGRRIVPAVLTAVLLLPGARPALGAGNFVFLDEEGGWVSGSPAGVLSEEETAGALAAAAPSGLTGSGLSAATPPQLTAPGLSGETLSPFTGLGLSAATPSQLAAPGLSGETLTQFTGSGFSAATPSQLTASTLSVASPAQLSQAALYASSLGDLWDAWEGDFSFLDGSQGLGTEEKPYQIRTKAQLMGLSQLAAMSMSARPGSQITVGDYSDAYFELTADLDLGGVEWIPIGYYRDSSEFSGEVPCPFTAHFDGNGRTVSNFKLLEAERPFAGFFGALEGAEIRDLNLRPGKPVAGSRSVGILAGVSEDSRIVGCTVNGSAEGSGCVGGIAGQLRGSEKAESVAENCTALVTLNVSSGAERFAGGIAGKAERSSIVDCRVETGDNTSARIQGADATVGGIVGLQNDADLYNSYVSGTIGGSGSRNVGGMVGQRVAGKLKVARFEGTIGQSGTGAAGHRGTFIGYRDAAAYFRYGEDVAWLFADTEGKIAANVCGSGIPDDNLYTYSAHIGYSHSGDNYYTLVQGGVTRKSEDYYYEELERGILAVLDGDLDGVSGTEETGFELDHFAAGSSGRPVRGYLVSVPQIDTAANGRNYYDVAVLEVRGNSAYCRTIDKDNRGAIAPGTAVTVSTSPRNTGEARFQMDGVPTYEAEGRKRETTYRDGGCYVFTMPEANTEVTAVYKKVAVSVNTVPERVEFRVRETRTGDRKNSTLTTTVSDQDGRQLATYVNGVLQGTQVYPVLVEAVVDQNNDVADSSVRWSVDDVSLVKLLPNADESGGYTNQSASIQVRLDAPFIVETREKLETAQRESGYKNKIPDTIFGAGHQNNGVAILTAATRPSASFDGKPCTATAEIAVTYQIIDNTYLGVEGASLDHPSLTFEVVRTLTGDRKAPQETISVTAPKPLQAAFSPDYFDRDEISWSVDDAGVLSVEGQERQAIVRAYPDAAWIRNLVAQDAGKHENDPYAKQTASGVMERVVTVKADDRLGNYQEASCAVTVRFRTEDQSIIRAEGISVSPQELAYNLKLTKSGPRSNPSSVWTGNDTRKLAAAVLPENAFHKEISYTVSDDSLTVKEDGTVSVNTQAAWIRAVNSAYPYRGSHTAVITATTEDGGFQGRITVNLTYELSDSTYSSSGRGGGSSGGGGGSSGSGSGASGSGSGPAGSGPASSGTGTGPAGNGTGSAGEMPAESVNGTWAMTKEGLWTFASGGRTYRDEWAYVQNPYASGNQSPADWFRFDSTGHMMAGWYADADGTLYYLWPYFDGTQGHMVTGWHWIPGADGLYRRYYFHEISDGTRGHLYRNTAAPDGSFVNEAGEWTVNGQVQLRAVSPKV